ncbi:MAG: hypothetical protein ABJE10_06840, partial [bacterium]
MKHVRIDVRDAAPAGASGALGAGLESHLPASVNAHSAATVTRETKSRRSWLTGGLRLVRNAAIAVAIMTLIPVSAVMLSGSRLSRVLAYNYTSKRAIAAAPMRAFTLSADLSITPMQAGLAFNALQESRKVVPGFPAIEPVSRPAAYWRTEKLAPGMFATAGPSLYSGPSSVGILEAVAKGFSPAEMNYLRALNASPIWHEY